MKLFAARRKSDPIPLKQPVAPHLKKKRILIISGPTAAGKTALSFPLATALGGEIVSADSCQVYRGMDIGTAKPSPEERASIAHHLIDICDINEPFNVAEFYKQSQECFREIISRENVPIVVGGSGFYIHSLLYGPPMGPPSNPEIRADLERQLRELGPEVLYERLQMFDPSYAATISEHDKHKIIRALEIMALSEKRVSDFTKDTAPQEYDFRCWFLYYPREILNGRIERRCDEMLSRGFLDEVIALEKQGLRSNSSASQAIGYRQALAHLDNPDYERFVSDFKKASRHYSKRQFTWFRKEPQFRWLNMAEHTESHLLELILQDFEQGL